MSNDYTFSDTSKLAGRHLNTSVPRPPFVANSFGASCAVSQLPPRAEVLLSTGGDTATSSVVRENSHSGFTPSNSFKNAPVAAYTVKGNITRQNEIDAVDKCLNSSLVTSGVEFQGKCIAGGAMKHADVTSDGDKIQWRSNKKKKQTVSAALLIALGVAGIILGS